MVIWARVSGKSDVRVSLEDRREITSVGIKQPLTVVVSARVKGERDRVCHAATCTGYFKGLWIDESGTTVYFSEVDR